MWLDAHGFPDAAQIDVLWGSSEEALRAAARSGQQGAAETLAYKLFKRNAAPGEISDLLRNRAAEGSVYALFVLSDLHWRKGPLQDPVRAHAYGALAGHLGYTDAFLQNAMRSGSMDTQQRFRAAIEFESMRASFLTGYQRRHGRPWNFVQRPVAK